MVADLSEFVSIMNNLGNSLYETKQNVNAIQSDQLSTHVTAQDLNNIKDAITKIAENINEINKYLINASSSSNTNNSESLIEYFDESNQYVKQTQLVVDGNVANDSIIYLDEYYLRVKNIFIDGYKTSYNSPYNLVSWNQFNNTLRQYLKETNSYAGGRFITIDPADPNGVKKVHCNLSGDEITLTLNESTKKIGIKPSTTDGQILKTVNHSVSWQNETKYVPDGTSIMSSSSAAGDIQFSIKPFSGAATKVLKTVGGEVMWGDDDTGGGPGTTYSPGTYIFIDGENKINCKLIGDNTTIKISGNTDSSQGKIYIPSGNAGDILSTTPAGVTWTPNPGYITSNLTTYFRVNKGGASTTTSEPTNNSNTYLRIVKTIDNSTYTPVDTDKVRLSGTAGVNVSNTYEQANNLNTIKFSVADSYFSTAGQGGYTAIYTALSNILKKGNNSHTGFQIDFGSSTNQTITITDTGDGTGSQFPPVSIPTNNGLYALCCEVSGNNITYRWIPIQSCE